MRQEAGTWGSAPWRVNPRQEQSTRGGDSEGLKQEPGCNLYEVLSDLGNSEQGRWKGAAPQALGCACCALLL